jgi:hypothetical protein
MALQPLWFFCRFFSRKAVPYTQISMPWVGFEPTIPGFEEAKTVHALDCAATSIGVVRYGSPYCNIIPTRTPLEGSATRTVSKNGSRQLQCIVHLKKLNTVENSDQFCRDKTFFTWDLLEKMLVCVITHISWQGLLNSWICRLSQLKHKQNGTTQTGQENNWKRAPETHRQLVIYQTESYKFHQQVGFFVGLSSAFSEARIVPTQYVYVFHMIPTINNDYFPQHH